MEFVSAEKPTLYFIGVTTSKSSIMKVFPRWAKEVLGLGDVEIKGIDLPLHAPAQMYRETVEFIKNDLHSEGALVTTHKLDLYNACKGMFEYVDPFTLMLGEISSISKKDGKLCGHAKDPISSGLALECFIPENHWKDTGADVLLFGAGGSSLAMSMYLTQEKWEKNIPKRIIIANRSIPRLEEAAKKLAPFACRTKFEFIHSPEPTDNDRLLASIKPCSLIVNATGLGKDAPGSPITDAAIFPRNSFVWEINYRGELDFMHQAERRKDSDGLFIEDGWIYFIFGWTQVIAEVFHIPIEGETLRQCERIALLAR